MRVQAYMVLILSYLHVFVIPVKQFYLFSCANDGTSNYVKVVVQLTTAPTHTYKELEDLLTTTTTSLDKVLTIKPAQTRIVHKGRSHLINDVWVTIKSNPLIGFPSTLLILRWANIVFSYL